MSQALLSSYLCPQSLPFLVWGQTALGQLDFFLEAFGLSKCIREGEANYFLSFPPSFFPFNIFFLSYFWGSLWRPHS